MVRGCISFEATGKFVTHKLTCNFDKMGFDFNSDNCLGINGR